MGFTRLIARTLFGKGVIIPTYQYQCDNCGHSFEKFQSMSASVMKKCPECKKFKLKRLIGSGSGIIFKGTGFYETDYKRKDEKKKKKQP